MYSVIYAGVDLESFRKAQPDKNAYLTKYDLKGSIFTIGMIGNLKKQKNPVEFVEIAKRLLESDQNVQFIFAGDGPLRNEVSKRLHWYGIEDKVKFIGWVDDPQNFMNSLDIFILTSLWEGLPCTLSQAIVSEKPCIATNIGGNKEILKDLKTGFLYEPGEIERAAEIIHSIKNNNPKKPVADKNKDKYLKKFDFRYILKQHEQLYDRLLFKH
jgi:glycosyltransferase involved in cell wall biosynthesis